MPSAKILEQKKVDLKQLVEKLKNATTIILADYRGLTVEQDTELRTAFRKSGVTYNVVKNTLLRLALKEIGISGLENYLEGPTAIAISNDIVAPAKVLSQYSDKFEPLQIKAGLIEGKIVDAKEVDAIAKLPSREELVAKALAGFNAPISGFVNVLNGNIRGLAIALNAIYEQKQSA